MAREPDAVLVEPARARRPPLVSPGLVPLPKNDSRLPEGELGVEAVDEGGIFRAQVEAGDVTIHGGELHVGKRAAVVRVSDQRITHVAEGVAEVLAPPHDLT